MDVRKLVDFKGIEERRRQQLFDREASRERYGADLTDYDFRILNQAYADEADDEEYINNRYRAGTAMKISRMYGIPYDYAYKNLDDLMQYEYPHADVPKTWYKAVGDSFALGTNQKKLAAMGLQLMALPEGEARNNLWEEIEAIGADNLTLKDGVKRNWFLEGLKGFGESWAFTASAAAAGALGSLGTPALGVVSAAAVSAADMTGLEYINLLSEGVDDDTARRVAAASGTIQGIVEAALGDVAALGSRTGLGQMIFRRLHYAGAFGTAARTLGGRAVDSVMEGVGEAVQEKISQIYTEQAKQETERRTQGAVARGELYQDPAEKAAYDLAAAAYQEYYKQTSKNRENTLTREASEEQDRAIFESFRVGFLTSLVTGIPISIRDFAVDVKGLRRLDATAKTTPSLEALKAANENNPALSSLTPEEREKVIEDKYNFEQERRGREEARIAAEIKERGSQLAGLEERTVNAQGEDETPGAYRTAGGTLYTRIEDEKREGGVVTGSFRMGDGSMATESNTYGAIDYRIENGVLTITGMNIADHRRELTNEFFQDFAKKFADNDIQWDPETAADMALKEQLAAANRRGPEAGLNYFEPEAVRGEALEIQQAKQNFDRQLAEALPRTTAESRQGVISLLDRIGKGYGLEFDGFLDRLGFDRDNIFTNTPNQDVADFNSRAAQYAKDPGTRAARGAMFKLLKKLDSDVKAVEYTVVYLDPESADFSTVVHELKHAVDNFLEQADPDLYRRMMDAAGAYDPASGLDEKTWRKERSAYAFENYLQTGEAPTPELRGLFRRMVEWLRDIVNHLSGMRKLTPEQKAAFDELLTRADSFENGPESPGTAQDTSNAAGSAAGASTALTGDFGDRSDMTKTGQFPGFGGRVDSDPVQADGYDDIDAWVATLPVEQQENYRRNKALNESRESLSKNDKKIEGRTDSNLIIEGVGAEDLGGLKTAARTAYPKIREIAQRWAKDYGGEVKGRPVPEGVDPDTPMIKGDKRAIEKHEEEDTPYNQMLDMVGFTVVVDDMATLLKMAKEVIPEGAVVRAKDRYRNSTPGGYRDFLLNIRTEDGFVGEIQLNVRQMFDAKENFGGHALYEVRRSLTTEVKNGKIDPAVELKDKELLRKISDKFYGKAYGLVLAETAANASSLDMSSPSFSAYTSKNGEADNVLSEFTLNNLEWLLAQAFSRHQTNRNDGSSNNGTSGAAGLGEDLTNRNLGDSMEAGASSSAKSATSLPSTSNIGQTAGTVKGQIDISGVPAIREKYRAAKKTYGRKGTINVNGARQRGRYVIAEAGTFASSHTRDFTQTPNFPRRADGTTVNDNDYQNRPDAQESTRKQGNDFDQRGMGIVGTRDGIIVSGNGRNIAAQIAAGQGTNTKYLEDLRDNITGYGLTEADLEEYRNPELVFELEEDFDYSTEAFAQFNVNTKKAASPMETAVKMSKRLAEKPDVIRNIAAVINEHDSLPELYKDKKAIQGIFNTLQTNKIIGDYDRPQYVDEKGKITRSGEDFLESVMLGSVLEEGNIRGLYDAPAMRQKLVRGITALVENKGMGDYSLIPEMNEAVEIALAVNNTVGRDGKRTYGTVRDYVNQQILPGMPEGLSVGKRASVQLAEALESGGQKDFALWYGGLNASLAEAAKGQSELFTGAVESKEVLLDRYTGYREDLGRRKAENRKTLTDPSAGTAAKAAAALDDAGMAKTETLLQIIGERGAEALDQAEESTIRLDNLAVARQMEAAGKDARAVRLATGWERGADGKWRYEIGDIVLHGRLKDGSLEYGAYERLPDIIDNKALFTAYPELETIAVEVKHLPGEVRGIYDTNVITLDESWTRERYEYILVHEIQHAIQKIEGFARGAGMSTGRENYTKTAGEVEARNVQARMGFTAQRRLETLLEETEDVNREDQVFLTEGVQIRTALAEADGTLFQTAYHGTPYWFEDFDTSYMGRGEGVQVHGWGIYLSASEAVAEGYRRQLSDGVSISVEGDSGKYVLENSLWIYYNRWQDPVNVSYEQVYEAFALTEFNNAEGNIKKAEKAIKQQLKNGDIDKETADKAINFLHEGLVYSRPGFKYQVEIPDQNEFLDERKKFNEQSDYVKKALKKLAKNNKEGIDFENNIKDFDGEGIYSQISTHLGSDRLASELLFHYGIKGISYIGDTRYAKGGAQDYVVFNESQIEVDRVLFQTYEEFLEDAARYASAADFEAAYRDPETRPEDAYISTAADRKWFEIFWEDARTVFGAGGERSPGAPERGDRAFLTDINRENLQDILVTLDEAVHAQQKEPAAPEAGEDRAAYDAEMAEYRKAQALKARISRELPHYGAWVGAAAKAANGGKLSPGDYNTLRGYMRNAPRDYRALFAELADRPEWGLNLTEMKDGVPDTPLSAPRMERPDDMDQANRDRLAEAVGDADPDLARGIREGTLAMDDPRIRAFDQGLAAGEKKAEAAIAAVEEEIAGDARKFRGAVQGRALDLYREFKEAEEKYQARTTDLAQKIRRGEDLTGRYRQEDQLLFTDFDAAWIAFDDFVAAENLRTEIREELARIDARYAERRRLRDLQKKRNAVREVRRIEESLVKRIVRKISLKTVDHDQAVAITIVQSFFEPSLIAGVNHRLGTVRGPAIRELYEKWKTDADFREDLRRQAGSRATKIADILGKPQWDYITNQEKRDLIRMLPKKNWIAELGLEKLEAYREDLVPLDIKISGEGKAVLGTAEEQIAREALGDELYTRIQNKPMEAWTMLELAELAEAVDDLYVEGRENLRAKNEARYIQYENYRNKLSDILRITGYRINDGDSPEEQQRKQAEIAKILGKYAAGDPGTAAAKLVRRGRLENLFGGAYFDANIRRVARILDNGKDGTFTNLLYWQENDAYNLRERAKMNRALALDASMRELGIKMPELFRKVVMLKNFFGPGIDQVYTVEELLGMKLAARDELSRRAVVYGNLATETERKEARNNNDPAAMKRLDELVYGSYDQNGKPIKEGRFTKVMAAADAFFAQEGNGKYLKFLEAVGRDYDGVYDRLNRANIATFNEPVWKVEHYFPMFRLDQTGGVNERQEVKDLLGLAGATTQWTDDGMTQRRIKMGPQNQTGIELGLYTTWAKSLDRVEHFIAYAPYVRSLNMVFKSRDGKALMQQLQDRYGEGMGNYLKEYINEKANPNAENNRHASDNIVKAMRGRTASAYLAWKISGVFKQAVASPWPYLQHMNPLEYGNACIRFYRNPKAVSDFIKEKSVFMANRTFDPVIKIIREQQALNRNKALGKIDRFNNLGMKGLEMIDWACVAPGWLAVYDREMARLQKANEGLAADAQLSMADMEYEAVAKADDIVRLTQPSGRDTDQAPMFKNTSQTMKAILQFTQSLNVIWQNIRYDMPAAIREGQTLQVVGTITGYILAGVSLGLLTEGLGGDDEEKDVAWQRKLLYYSFTQFTDAVPFIGDAATKAWETAATGRFQWSGGNNIFPVAKEVEGSLTSSAKAAYKLVEGDAEAAKKAAVRGLLHFEAGLAYSLGIPQSGARELLRAIGIDPWQDDFDPGLNPGAFAGRR